MKLEEKRTVVNEILQKNGFDLDQIDADFWPEAQVDEFLKNIEKGLKEAREYVESL